MNGLNYSPNRLALYATSAVSDTLGLWAAVVLSFSMVRILAFEKGKIAIELARLITSKTGKMEV